MAEPLPIFQNELDEISCAQCGAPLRIRGMGRSTVIGCEYCGAVNGLSGQHLRLLEEGQKLQNSLLIPLGSRGKFENTEFELIGCIVRSDRSGQYLWSEYLLFNPYRGYRWLVEQNGHWLYVSGEPKLSGLIDPHLGISEIDFENETYTRYDSGNAIVVRVIGECYWEVKSADTTKTVDYISPPFMLSFEKSEGEIIGSKGVYIEVGEVEDAFKGAKLKLPSPSGVAPAQPNPYRQSAKYIGYTYLALLAILTLFQIVSMMRANSKLLYSNSLDNAVYVDPVSGASKPETERITPPFVIESGPSNIRVDLSAPVNNSWVSVNVSLVNQEGELVDEKEVEVSYYHGYDSDGSWTEGRDTNYIYFEKVPAGKYSVSTTATTNIQTSTASNGRFAPKSTPASYSLKVYNRVPYWGNYIFVLMLISMYPMYLKMRGFGFESKRNQNSDELSGDQ